MTGRADLQSVLDRAADGGRITPEEALELYRSAPLHALGSAADALRRRRYAGTEHIATYIIERNINYTKTLQGAEPDSRTNDLIGRIASLRATLAVIQHHAETIIAQALRALEYLNPDNLPVRTATTWTLGYAYQLQGDRAAASQAYSEVIDTGKSFGDSLYTTAATITLGQLQEEDNQLPLAIETYERALQLAGDPPQRMASEAFLGLARIYYEWNNLDAAQQYGQQCAQLTQQMEIHNVGSRRPVRQPR